MDLAVVDTAASSSHLALVVDPPVVVVDPHTDLVDSILAVGMDNSLGSQVGEDSQDMRQGEGNHSSLVEDNILEDRQLRHVLVVVATHYRICRLSTWTCSLVLPVFSPCHHHCLLGAFAVVAEVPAWGGLHGKIYSVSPACSPLACPHEHNGCTGHLSA